MRMGSRAAVLGVASLFAMLALTATANADPIKCRNTIKKESLKFQSAKAKVLQKCEAAVLGGKLPAVTDCHTESKAQAGIAKAVSKLHAGIAKQCGGLDKNCATTGDNDNVLAAPISWPSTCPGIEGGTCTNPIANCEDVADCIECVSESAIDQMTSVVHDDMHANTQTVGSVEQKCQSAISKLAMGFFQAKRKSLNKCWAGVDKGLTAGPCPANGFPAGKTEAALVKAESKKSAGMCKACGGASKACDDDVDGSEIVPGGVTIAGVAAGDDLSVGTLGFGGACPAVTLPRPPGTDCSTLDDIDGAANVLDSLREVILCLDCVTEFKTDCLDSLSQPDHEGYPALCQPPPTCPTQVTFVGTAGSLGVLDPGASGQSHDAQVISDGLVTVNVTGCSIGTQPNCGICTYTGPTENEAGTFQSKRCTGNTRILCDDATGAGSPDCTGNGTCEFHFGTLLPLSAGGVSTCVSNRFVGSVSGTFNEVTGSSAGTASLISTVFSGPTADAPCPKCVGDGVTNDGTRGGTCDSGLNSGQTCDVNGSSPNVHFGATSLDCPPLGGGQIAALPIDLTNTTGTRTKTLSAASPNCRAPGFTGLECFCDTCNNLAATVCDDDADCLAVGATTCGGRRCIGGGNAGTPCTLSSECPGGSCNVPGEPTKPNNCSDGNCDTAQGGNDFECSAGPFDTFCEPTAQFKSCVMDSECAAFPGNLCTGGKNRECFNDNGVSGNSVNATGVADAPVGHQSDPTLASLFCIGPTSSGAVNSVAGIPGLGRLELPGHAEDNGTP